MTYAEQLHMEAKARRQRIEAAAVPDIGIDLKRKKLMTVQAPTQPPVMPAASPSMREPSPALEETPISTSIGKISVNKIIQIISDTYLVDIVDMVSARRHLEIVTPRHVAIYFAKKLTTLSLPGIGRMFGHRDHTTVLSAHNKIKAKADKYPLFAVELARLEIIILEAHNACTQRQIPMVEHGSSGYGKV